MTKTTILFDFDSTLVDSLGYWCKTIENLSFKHYGLKVDKRLKGITHGGYNIDKAKKFIECTNISASYTDVLNVWYKQMEYFYTHKVKIIKGAKAYLNKLKKQGKQLILVSATDEKTLLIALKHFDIDLFDNIFTEPGLNMSKSNPLFYQTIINELKITPESILLFEDSFGSTQSAHSLGIECIGIINKYNKKHKEDFKQICIRTIKDYTDKTLPYLND